MSDNNKQFINSIVRKLAKMTYIRPNEIPDIDLYMDQVTTFMEDHLKESKRYSDDKILTKTMINNYAKNDLLPPPVKKKYSKDHMIMLIFIYYFKNIMSINDIQALLTPLSDSFFDHMGSVSLEKIYKEEYNNERASISDLVSSITKMQAQSENMFNDIEDEDEKRYLQLFSLVCMLSFDVYTKKHVIESVVDELNSIEKLKNNKKKK